MWVSPSVGGVGGATLMLPRVVLSSPPLPVSHCAQFMKAMQKQLQERAERTEESRDAEVTTLTKASSKSSASTSCNSSDSEPATVRTAVSRSMEDLRGSSVPVATVKQHETPDSQDVDFDLETVRRCQSEVVQGQRKAPPMRDRVELEDLLGVRPSPQMLNSLVTLSRAEFQQKALTLKEFCECGLYTTLKWKLRLALAKLPGHCLPLTVDHSFVSHRHQQDDTVPEPDRMATEDGPTAKRTLVGLLYQAASSVECSPEEGVSGGTNGSLFKDLLYWVEVLPRSQ